ncbi:MAG: glucosaminidase domain-containing protein [Alphaproteobacteria bacterium]
MTDVSLTGSGFNQPPDRPNGTTTLFALGFAAGVGAVLTVFMLQSPDSLIDSVRAARDGGYVPPVARVSVDLLPTDLSAPPPPIEDDPAPPDSEAQVVSAAPDGLTPIEPVTDAMTVAALESAFEEESFRLEPVRAGEERVPRLMARAVPTDLEELVEVDRRKAVFFRMVLPLVLQANEQIRADRARIIDLQAALAAGEALKRDDALWLAGMFGQYGVETEDVPNGDFETLLRRVDIIAPSLALAQAAIESGWGTSRFAREGNALFGQWVYDDDADGIVPAARPEGMSHRIRAFETPLQSVVAYMRNLNTHRAYRPMRDIRERLRRQGAPINGMTLAEGLESYSEKGREYIDMVRSMINANNLRPLDRARLEDGRA